MAKKGTPEYYEWLEQYRAKRQKKLQEVETPSARSKKPDEATSSRVKKPVQPSLFPEEEKKVPENLYSKGTRKMVHSKSQNKDIEVEVIRFVPKNNKYLVSRNDGKFLYYAHEDLKDLPEKSPEEKVQTLKQGDSVAVVPAGSLSEKIETTLRPVIADLNYEGLIIDKDEVNSMIEDTEKQMYDVKEKLKQLAGREINPNASRDLAALLYDEMHYPLVNGRSTSEDTLEALAMTTSSAVPDNVRAELPNAIISFRKSSKLLKSYLYKLRDIASIGDGKIYNMFDTTALSGRFTTAYNPVAVEIPDSVKTEKKIYFQEDLNEIGLGSVCPIH